MASDRLRRAVTRRPYGLAALLLAVVAGLLVLLLAHDLFPYHSRNHDEGVYLQQAAMLLEGQLFLRPGSEALAEAVHPWFFVEGDRGLYPKYAPVPAAVFAVGKLLGGYRLALGIVAAVNVGLGYLLASAAFDRRTGLLAAAILAGAPLFLVNSATFLPYATTTALNLLFAVAYVRSVRRGDGRYAVLAGAAIGLAFFARPYTAVLFALPFMGHAIWRLIRALPDDRAVHRRTALTAGVGLLFVAVTLGYNLLTTGAAVRFPYQAFAPHDGVGFGRRALLDYEVQYTPGLALRANGAVLGQLLTEWFTAGVLGSVAAGVGLLAVGRRLVREGLDRRSSLSRAQLQLLLAGVIVTVTLGNVAFWGNLNILGRLGVPDDGFISVLGPFYHFDLLLPLSAFAAHGVLSTARGLRERAADRLTDRTLRLAAVGLLVVALPLVGAAEVDALAEPLDRNRAQTERLTQAYAPFEETTLENALVFLPPTYGEWRNHPFQWLRNEPGFGGPAVYALERHPTDDFAVIDAYPDRALYRYRYHGVWSPDERVTPLLERVRLVEGEAVTARTTVAVPDRIIDLRAAVRVGDRVRRYEYRGELAGDVSFRRGPSAGRACACPTPTL
ncbi:MAG: glycosyltransferase family 39 protein [Halobacteriales archaeon]|nr:glycosyltransferase family 39 protein [Halobacteriales archaeon]